MKRIKVCSVVRGETLDEFLERLEYAQRVSEMVELRVDAIKNVSVADVSRVREKTVKESIFTCRKREEGGVYEGDEGARADIMQRANKEGFDYLDIEFSSYKMLTQKEKKTKLIYSFHDFQKTPSYEALKEKTIQMENAGADIIKLATMVNSEDDVKILLRILLEKKEGQEMIVVGMGEKGRITRVLAPLLGGYLTYASFEGNTFAPGQIDIHILKRITNTLTRITS